MPASDDSFQWQSSMASLIFAEASETDPPSHPSGWRCSNTLDCETVLMIYRRNLKGGVESNLTKQFPVTHAYLGSTGFRQLAQSLVIDQPPTSPLFKVYAAQLPCFISQFESFDGRLRAAAAALATIDFFSVTVTQPDQMLPMDRRYFDLFCSVSQACDEQDSERKRSGLYQLLQLHPETVANKAIVDGYIRSNLHGEQLNVEFCAHG